MKVLKVIILLLPLSVFSCTQPENELEKMEIIQQAAEVDSGIFLSNIVSLENIEAFLLQEPKYVDIDSTLCPPSLSDDDIESEMEFHYKYCRELYDIGVGGAKKMTQHGEVFFTMRHKQIGERKHYPEGTVLTFVSRLNSKIEREMKAEFYQKDSVKYIHRPINTDWGISAVWLDMPSS